MPLDQMAAPAFSGLRTASLPPLLPSPPTPPAGLHLALIAPDSLTWYASQLHQAFLHTLCHQREQRQRTQPDVAAETEVDVEDDDDERCIHPSPVAHKAVQQSPSSTAEELPHLSQVALYIHLPEEATMDFIVRLQQGALPRGLLEQHIGGASRLLHQHEEEEEEEDVDDDDEDGQQLREGKEGEQEAHSPDADEEQAASDEQRDGEEDGADEVSGELHWRAMDGVVGAGRVSSAASESSSSAASEDDGGQSFTPPLAPLFTPRHHPDPSQPTQERMEATATLPSHPHVHQQPQAEAEAPPASAREQPIVPPLDLFRLFPAACHVNLLLYDGLREDIAFAYFQVSHASTRSQSVPSHLLPSV